MRSRTTDIAAGFAVLGVAGLFHSQSTDLTGVSLLFPRMLIIFMTLGGIFLVISGALKSKTAKTDDEPVNVQRVVIISIGSILYVLLIPLLGFYPASILFLFGSAMILGDANPNTTRKAAISAAFAAVICLAVWLGFALMLSVPTPQSVLF
jgi:hypothetical protein